MATTMKDNMGPYIDLRGELTVKFCDKAGKIVHYIEGSNMIMTVAKVTLSKLIGGDTTGKSVTKIALGNDAAIPAPDNLTIGGLTSTVLTPGANMVGGVMKAYIKSLLGHTYPAAGRIAFEWALDYGEANGLEIKEYALVCDDLTMFSRKTRGVVTKSSGLSATGVWTIIF